MIDLRAHSCYALETGDAPNEMQGLVCCYRHGEGEDIAARQELLLFFGQVLDVVGIIELASDVEAHIVAVQGLDTDEAATPRPHGVYPPVGVHEGVAVDQGVVLTNVCFARLDAQRLRRRLRDKESWRLRSHPGALEALLVGLAVRGWFRGQRREVTAGDRPGSCGADLPVVREGQPPEPGRGGVVGAAGK